MPARGPRVLAEMATGSTSHTDRSTGPRMAGLTRFSPPRLVIQRLVLLQSHHPGVSGMPRVGPRLGALSRFGAVIRPAPLAGGGPRPPKPPGCGAAGLSRTARRVSAQARSSGPDKSGRG